MNVVMAKGANSIPLSLIRLLGPLSFLLVLSNQAFSKSESGHSLLSHWRIFDFHSGIVSLKPEFQPYIIQAPLFTDYALKWRAFKIPRNTHIKVSDTGELDFPERSIVIKTFYYPIFKKGKREVVALSDSHERGLLLTFIDRSKYRPIETRILFKYQGQWQPYVYIWNKSGSEATLRQQGAKLPLVGERAKNSVTVSFDYSVPSRQQCSECHGGFNPVGNIELLGPELEQLNAPIKLAGKKQSQLEYWQAQGLLKKKNGSTIEYTPHNSPAREYLHINCAHCHNRHGTANSSRLFLGRTQEVGLRLGVCKPTIAAGRGAQGKQFDIFPGRPEHSVLLLRMMSDEPDIRMPEVGRSLVDESGISLISKWITSLSGENNTCNRDVNVR